MPGPGRKTTGGARSNPSMRTPAAPPDTSAAEEGTNKVGDNSANTSDNNSPDTKSADAQTAEQAEIQRLKDELAKALGNKDPEVEYDKAEEREDNILVHFVRDGFCDLGAIWYKGQELEVSPGTAQYESVKKWANLDSTEQEERFGAVYFRQGPWKGKGYEDPEAAAAEARRGRAAPRVSYTA